MAWINTRGTRLSQPQGPVVVSDEYRLKSPVLIGSALNAYRNVLDNTGTINGSGPFYSSTPQGQVCGVEISTSSGIVYPDYAFGGTSPITVVSFIAGFGSANGAIVSQGTEIILRTNSAATGAEFILNSFTTNDRVSVTSTARPGGGIIVAGTYGATGKLKAYANKSVSEVTPTGTYANVAAAFSGLNNSLLARFNGGALWYGVFASEFAQDEIYDLVDNPWQLFKPVNRRLYFDVGGGAGGLSLTGANSASTTTASTGAITQAHNLAGANSVQTNTAGTGSIGSTIILAGTAGSSATTGTTGAVGQIHVLGGANSSSAGVASTGAITQVHVLAGANATQTNTGSTAALGDTAINLAGSAGSSATVASTGAITQVHALVGAASVQDNVASASAIVQAHMLAGAAGVSASVGSVGAVVVFDYAVTPSPYIAYVPAVPHLALVPAVQSTAIRGL